MSEDLSFRGRVQYAIRALKRLGQCEDSRAFDTCFEMHDGAMVVTAILRASAADPELAEAIGNETRRSPEMMKKWRAEFERYAHLSDAGLEEAAAAERARSKAEFTAWADAGFPPFAEWKRGYDAARRLKA